jgi:Tfp pilus assembly protein PilV
MSSRGSARTDDAGVTMIDVVVAMTLMSVFMSIFTGAVVQMFRSASKNLAIARAQSQVTNAYLRLDKEIRYAAGISDPGPVGADTYVEYLTNNTGVATCTELRLNSASGQLQRRSWPQAGTPPAPTAWVPLASAVSSAKPFTLWPADAATLSFQRLQLTLDATAGSGATAAKRRTDVTFTALNTTPSTSSTAVCSEGRSLP